MNDIFISYSRHDTDVVNEIVTLLEQEGYSIWIDRDGIESGEDFKRVILKAIKESKVVLFFSSEHSNVSDWTAKEIGVAVKYKKHIVPIKLDDSNFNEAVEFDLINLDYIDYSKSSIQTAMRDKLLKTLRNKIGNGSKELERLEAERKAKEEAERARLERERLERFEAERKAEEAKRKAEQERLERERAEAQHRAELERANQLKVSETPKRKSNKTLWIAITAFALILLIVLVVFLPASKNSRERNENIVSVDSGHVEPSVEDRLGVIDAQIQEAQSMMNQVELKPYLDYEDGIRTLNAGWSIIEDAEKQRDEMRMGTDSTIRPIKEMCVEKVLFVYEKERANLDGLKKHPENYKQHIEESELRIHQLENFSGIEEVKKLLQMK